MITLQDAKLSFYSKIKDRIFLKFFFINKLKFQIKNLFICKILFTIFYKTKNVNLFSSKQSWLKFNFLFVEK